MKRKLLFLCHGIGNGGAERVISTLANAFCAKGYEVCLVVTNPPKNDYFINSNIKLVSIVSFSKNILFRTIYRIYKLRRLFVKFNPDCIISFSATPNMQATAAGLFFRKKIIVSERTNPACYPESKFGRFLRLFLYFFATKIVFQTPQALNYFPNYLRKKGVIIFNPVREDIPQPYEGVRECKIVGIGSLSKQKNWDVALHACKKFFALFPNYSFDIYGIGPEYTHLKNLIDASEILKNRVTLKGFAYEAVENLCYAKMYVSSSNYEGISNAMLEALAVGTPVVCSDCPVGGARLFVESGKNGFLFPVGDSDQMFDKMKILAENPVICEEFSKNSIQIREKLALSKIVNEWQFLIDSIIYA